MPARILVAEDDPSVRSFVLRALSMRGHDVTAVEDGTQALEKLATQDYELLLTDIVMPGLDGIQTLKGLLRLNPDLQVILLTGRATLRQAVEAMKLGALDLLEKPADIETLVARIADAAEKRSTLEDKHVEKRISDILLKKGW